MKNFPSFFISVIVGILYLMLNIAWAGWVLFLYAFAGFCFILAKVIKRVRSIFQSAANLCR